MGMSYFGGSGMTKPLVKWNDANLPPANCERLAQLEALAKEHNVRFYTLEVSPALKITLSYHSDTIFSKRIEGSSGVPFEAVLDEALKELRAKIVGHAKP